MAGIVDVRSGMECYIMNIIHTCQRFAEVCYGLESFRQVDSKKQPAPYRSSYLTAYRTGRNRVREKAVLVPSVETNRDVPYSGLADHTRTLLVHRVPNSVPYCPRPYPSVRRGSTDFGTSTVLLAVNIEITRDVPYSVRIDTMRIPYSDSTRARYGRFICTVADLK